MDYTIDGEMGIIVRQHKHYNVVLFPKFLYEHPLADSALELVG
tara:strand:- start:40 stop:168 length:129 start_codon:yes stop_codon:yes gene_type:complete